MACGVHDPGMIGGDARKTSRQVETGDATPIMFGWQTISRMKWRNWFELLMPTMLVGAAWLALSGATSVYITWLDEWHQRVIAENVTSIRAAAEMQHALWELQVAVVAADSAPTPEQLPIAPKTVVSAEFHDALASAERASTTDEEMAVVGQIRDKFEEYARALDGALGETASPMTREQAAAMAVEIANLCDQLQAINQRLIEFRSQERRKWSGFVRTARLITAMLGTFVGVGLGYRAASRLRQRLAAIHVTLEGAAEGTGRVLVEPIKADGNLDVIDRQVKEVASRLHAALCEAEGAREEASRNERLAAVGRLAAGIAHELRNPLTSVKLLVQKAGQQSSSSGLRHGPLAVVQDEIARMESTIQSLLDFARPPVTRRVRTALRDVLQRAINLVQGRAERDGVRIECTEMDRPLIVECDPEQLHQVFVNLLLNGMDAMPTGGKLTVLLRRTTASSGAPDLDDKCDEKCDEMCEVVVMDEGPGIPESMLEHVFEPFVTTKARGTGLGLAISRRLVEEHDGELRVGNRPTSGAVFTIRLPCEAAPTNEVGPFRQAPGEPLEC